MDIENEGEDSFDPSEFIDNVKTDMSNFNDKLDGIEKENREYKETISRMRQAFGAEREQQPTNKPGGWLDDILDASLQAEKRGQGMPVTTKIGVELAESQAQIEMLKQLVAETKREVAEAKKSQDPHAQANQAMFMQMDDTLVGQIERIYGQFDEGVYKAGVEKLSDVLNYVRQNEPENWENIRRNKGVQQQIISRVVLSMIPPEAQRALQQQDEDDTPVTQDHFLTAAEWLGTIPVPWVREVLANDLNIQHIEFRKNGPYKYNKRN